MKYQPEFPSRFGCVEDAKEFCRRFFSWYNQDHHHAGLGLMTPDQVHYGQTEAVQAARQATLDRAFRTPSGSSENHLSRPPDQPPSGSIRP